MQSQISGALQAAEMAATATRPGPAGVKSVPMFSLAATTGQGLSTLHTFLSHLQPRNPSGTPVAPLGGREASRGGGSDLSVPTPTVREAIGGNLDETASGDVVGMHGRDLPVNNGVANGACGEGEGALCPESHALIEVSWQACHGERDCLSKACKWIWLRIAHASTGRVIAARTCETNLRSVRAPQLIYMIWSCTSSMLICIKFRKASPTSRNIASGGSNGECQCRRLRQGVEMGQDP